MVEFNRKKSQKRFLYSPLALVVLCLILLVVLKALWGVQTKERLSSEYLEREQGELSRAEHRKKELAQAVEYLKTDRGVESEIRSKFRVVKEGESVVVIVGDEAPASTSVSTTTPTGFWKKVVGWFGF